MIEGYTMSDYKPYLSVVVPVFGCADCLRSLCLQLHLVLTQLTNIYEVILVDDASKDDAWTMIQTLTDINPRIKGIRLARNFGQHNAISAGLAYTTGDWIIVMDCDLQDPPTGIIKLYKKAHEGFDVVFAHRSARKDSWPKRASSALFWKIFNYFAGSQSNKAIANFGIYSRRVIHHITQLKEQNRSFPLFVHWLGYQTAVIDIEHDKRYAGKSSYSLWQLWQLAIDMIVSHSIKPLKLTMQFGFLLSFFSLLSGCYLIIKKIFWGISATGWTSLMVSLYFLGCVIIFLLGLIGIYLGKTFDETKNRPHYIIDTMININDH